MPLPLRQVFVTESRERWMEWVRQRSDQICRMNKHRRIHADHRVKQTMPKVGKHYYARSKQLVNDWEIPAVDIFFNTIRRYESAEFYSTSCTHEFNEMSCTLFRIDTRHVLNLEDKTQSRYFLYMGYVMIRGCRALMRSMTVEGLIRAVQTAIIVLLWPMKGRVGRRPASHFSETELNFWWGRVALLSR